MKTPTRIWTGLGVSLLTAVMLLLAFHPFSLWPLAFVALVPMLVAQHRIMPVRWAGAAAAVGVGGWLLVFLTSMFGFGRASLVMQGVVLVVVIVQLLTVPGLRRFHIHTRYKYFVWQGVFDWVGVEMIRSFIPPINTHGFMAQTMYTQPWILQPISLFSIYGLSMIVILTNFAVAQASLAWWDRRWHWDQTIPLHPQTIRRWLVATVVILLGWGVLSLGLFLGTPNNAKTLRVAAVQHNYPRPGHQDTADSQVERLTVLAQQSRLAAQQGARLIVWPELGLGFDPQVEHTAELKALAAETRAFLYIGYGLNDSRGWRNEMVLLTPEGKFGDVYGKNHPTSPGEPRIVTAGYYPVHHTSIGRISTLICNDVHWTDTSRILADKGAQLIAVPTLEAPGIALEQLAQSVLRAVENRVAVVKTDAAYTAAIIDPKGRIVAVHNGSPKGAIFTLVADVSLGCSDSPYSRVGDWVGWINLAGLASFIVFQQRTAKHVRREE
jgi:apolipoprotein N-acyltransferase